MKGLKRTILLGLAASLWIGCGSLSRDSQNVNAPQNASKPKDSSSVSTPTPTPAPVATSSVAKDVTERIKFGKGKEGATVKGEVSANGSSTYTLGAKEGQVMNVEITSGKKGVHFDVVDKVTGDTLAENVVSFSEVLLSNGDYTIRVYSTKGGDTYTLKVSIVDYGDE